MSPATIALLEDLRSLDAVSANLTRVQARCTELLEENRALRPGAVEAEALRDGMAALRAENRALRSDIDDLLAENVELHRDVEELQAIVALWRARR